MQFPLPALQPSASDDNHLNRLVLLSQRNAWFVEHGAAWFRLERDRDIDLALATMMLSVRNERRIVEQPHQAGSATIERRGRRAVAMRLHEPGGHVLFEKILRIDRGLLTGIEWITPPYRDGWIDANTRLEVESTTRAELSLYLPVVPGSSGKLLTVHNETDSTSRDVVLRRGQSSVVPLEAAGHERTAFCISCDPERVENSTDPRQLGCVLVSESARAA